MILTAPSAKPEVVDEIAADNPADHRRDGGRPAVKVEVEAVAPPPKRPQARCSSARFPA